MSLVFVPVSAGQLRDWAVVGVLAGPVEAHAVTAGLQEAFDLDDPEDAERVALLVASVSALVRTGSRLVAVAEASARPRPGGDDDFGEVLTDALPFGAVTSLFADESGLDVAAAAEAAAGCGLAQAWELSEVEVLLAGADLLWYGPAEWGMMTAG